MLSHESGAARRTSADDLRVSVDIAIPAFILVDPMLGEPLPGIDPDTDFDSAQLARAAAWERHIEPIPLAPRVELPQHLHPYLVALTGKDDPLLELTLDLAMAERATSQARGLAGSGGAAHRIAGWLQSSQHMDLLAQHLGGMFGVNTTAFTRASYMRLVGIVLQIGAVALTPPDIQR